MPNSLLYYEYNTIVVGVLRSKQREREKGLARGLVSRRFPKTSSSEKTFMSELTDWPETGRQNDSFFV